MTLKQALHAAHITQGRVAQSAAVTRPYVNQQLTGTCKLGERVKSAALELLKAEPALLRAQADYIQQLLAQLED